jgi:hypothetical protein
MLNKIRSNKWFCLIFTLRNEHSFCNVLEIVSFCDVFEFIQTTLVLCRMLQVQCFFTSVRLESLPDKNLRTCDSQEKNIVFLRVLSFGLCCCIIVVVVLWRRHVESQAAKLELVAEHLKVIVVDAVQRLNVVIVQLLEVLGHQFCFFEA